MEGLESPKAKKGAHLQDPNLLADSLASPSVNPNLFDTTTFGAPIEKETQLPYSNYKFACPDKQLSPTSGHGAQVSNDQLEIRKGNTSPLRNKEPPSPSKYLNKRKSISGSPGKKSATSNLFL